MGTGDPATPTKPAKSSSTQDQPPPPTSYAEWAAAFQAYYHGATPPPGYFPPGVAPGQPHPYMWAGQNFWMMQPVLPLPYGPAPPFAAMYPSGPHGHPSMPPGPHPYPFGITSPGGAADATMAAARADQIDSKSSDGKDRSPVKRLKRYAGSPGGAANKGQDGDKSTPSQSAESGSDGSSDGSEEDNKQDSHDSRAYEQSGGSTRNTGVQATSSITALSIVPSSARTGRLAGFAPTTNLNVGCDYWNATPLAAATSGKGKPNPLATQSLVPNFQPSPLMAVPSREAAASDFWLQDERELKRQRRKQSNRESARRSRLRKQAECEELAARVDTLTVENSALRSEINRLVEERNKLSAENNALLEKLRKDCEKGSSGARISEVKNSENTYITQDNGKAFDPEPHWAQGLRQSREELGKVVEQGLS